MPSCRDANTHDSFLCLRGDTLLAVASIITYVRGAQTQAASPAGKPVHAYLALHKRLIDLWVMPDRDDLHTSRGQLTVGPAPGRHVTWVVHGFHQSPDNCPCEHSVLGHRVLIAAPQLGGLTCMLFATSQTWITGALPRHTQTNADMPTVAGACSGAAVPPVPRECSTPHCLPLPSVVHRRQ